MKAPRVRWSSVIFITDLRHCQHVEGLRQQRAYQGQQLASLWRCYRCRWGLGWKEVQLALTVLALFHARLLLRDGNRRAASLNRHLAPDEVHADALAADGETPSPSSPPHDLPSSRPADAPWCR